MPHESIYTNASKFDYNRMIAKHAGMQKEWNDEYRSLFIDSYFNNKALVIEDGIIDFVEKHKYEPACYWHYLSSTNANQGPLFIPAGLWHGCYNYTNEPAILIYHITNKWDGTDEERCHPDDMGWKYLREAK